MKILAAECVLVISAQLMRPCDVCLCVELVQRVRSMKPRLQQFATALEAIQAAVDTPALDTDDDDIP